jgi:hypothetical protein
VAGHPAFFSYHTCNGYPRIGHSQKDFAAKSGCKCWARFLESTIRCSLIPSQIASVEVRSTKPLTCRTERSLSAIRWDALGRILAQNARGLLHLLHSASQVNKQVISGLRPRVEGNNSLKSIYSSGTNGTRWSGQPLEKQAVGQGGLDEGRGQAWAAMYTMWGYKYGLYDSPVIKQEARAMATSLLKSRFCSMPTSSHPKVQAIVTEFAAVRTRCEMCFG